MGENKHYAVLTGDIIKSSKLSAEQLERVRETLLDGVAALRGWKRGLVKGNLSFFRGDSWQLLLTDPAYALRAVVYLRARLIASKFADSRIGVGIGRVDRISVKNITQSTGQAFSLSGEQLDAMKVPFRLAFVASESCGEAATLIPIVASLCDALISEWTPRQAEVVGFAVNPGSPTHEAIARALDPEVSRVAVTKSLNAAHWQVIQRAIEEFEQCL